MGLSERDRAVIDFERTWWKRPGSKEEGIRRDLGLSGARFYRVLAELSEEREAMVYDPLTVKRLRRRRAERRRAILEGTLPR